MSKIISPSRSRLTLGRKKPAHKITQEAKIVLYFIVTFVLIAIICSFTISSAFFYAAPWLSPVAINKAGTPSNVPSINIADSEVLQRLARHIVLPEGESVVATVINPISLREENPTFYRLAKVGDKVVIFRSQAILYDFKEDLILNVAPVFFAPPSQELAPTLVAGNEIEVYGTEVEPKLRATSSTEADILATLVVGDTVVATGQTDGQWVEVTHGVVTGWLFWDTTYLRIIK
jgi:hypothetical protein